MPGAFVSCLRCFWQRADFLLPIRSQTLINCTSSDFLSRVVYFYNMLKVICATSKHLERDNCWHLGCSYGYLNKTCDMNDPNLY